MNKNIIKRKPQYSHFVQGVSWSSNSPTLNSQGQFNYACVVIEPMELDSNRVFVLARDEIAQHVSAKPKIVSDSGAPLLARQMALHANVSGIFICSLYTFSPTFLLLHLISSWLHWCRNRSRSKTRTRTHPTGWSGCGRLRTYAPRPPAVWTRRSSRLPAVVGRFVVPAEVSDRRRIWPRPRRRVATISPFILSRRKGIVVGGYELRRKERFIAPRSTLRYFYCLMWCALYWLLAKRLWACS